MMGYDWGMGLGGWLWMLGGLVVLIGIVVLVVWAMNGFNRAADRRTDPSPRPDPMDILRERFARGEITEAEFEQVKRALGYDR
ncbi:MAG: SHOCT domain-containing protein [Candidatus Limnocylindrales bacterium]|nr:SHOCT domain-containing protein [Candidatus Limnocylindrales bacterium]